MNKSELIFLQESYEEIKLKNYIQELYNEGKTQIEIENILNEAGTLSRGLAHVKSLFNKDSLKNAGNYIKGKIGGSKVARKAGDYLTKKGLTTKKDVDNKLTDLQQKGYSAESNIRSKKLESLLNTHTNDVKKVFVKINDLKTEIVKSMNVLLDEIIEDYNKIGGLRETSVANLSKTLKNDIIKDFLDRPLYAFTDVKRITNEFRKNVIQHINKEKTSGKEGFGLRTADKLK
jgi:hypothetical protein